MLRDFVFWTAFAAVMLGIVFTLMQNYRRARARELELEALHAQVLAGAVASKAAPGAEAGETPAGPAASASVALPPSDVAAKEATAAVVEEAPASEAFDPTKTRLLVRAEATPATAGAPGGMPALVCLDGRQKGLRFSIPALGLTIGRAKDNDVIIIDGRVSAHHAWIGMVDGQPTLRDYQSLNGTFLNRKLDVAVSEAALGNGDILQFGSAGGDSYRFVVE
ncbi:MAG: FHA domain-containing protein [Rhodocyclales bacterium]|nr:FHA domain-containing protein [Rhodocyclales bacterium]